MCFFLFLPKKEWMFSRLNTSQFAQVLGVVELAGVTFVKWVSFP